jgi:imidazolonepropionase
LLITRIGELVSNAPDGFAAIGNAALVIEGDRIAWTGPAAKAPAADDFLDAAGRAVLPGFVDSHAASIGPHTRST